MKLLLLLLAGGPSGPDASGPQSEESEWQPLTAAVETQDYKY